MTGLMCAAIVQLAAVGAAPQSYDAAYADSMKSGRPLLVVIGADWCPACVQMKRNVLPELERRGDLEQVSVAVVNTDESAALANRLKQGGMIPQLVLYYKSGDTWRRTSMIGGQSASSVAAFIKKAQPGQAAAKEVPVSAPDVQ